MGKKARIRRSHKTDANGNCYEQSAKYVINNPTDALLLAHGRVSNPYNRQRVIDHAWVEISSGTLIDDGHGGRITLTEWACYDPTTLDKRALLLPRDAYYAIGAVHDVRRYSNLELRLRLLQYEHWGPWPECSATPTTQEEEP